MFLLMVKTHKSYAKQSNMATTINYFHEAVLDCRVRGIYGLLLTQRYKEATSVINDTMRSLRGPTPHLPTPVALMAFTHLSKCLIDIAFKRYNNAHDEIRQVHYKLDQPVNEDCADPFGAELYCDA